jgi:hypothetical protein
MAWLEQWFQRNDKCPEFIRASWKPVKKTIAKIKGF